MILKDLREFIFKSYYKQIDFTKEHSYYQWKKQNKEDLVLLATTLTKKISYPTKPKEHHESMNYF